MVVVWVGVGGHLQWSVVRVGVGGHLQWLVGVGAGVVGHLCYLVEVVEVVAGHNSPKAHPLTHCLLLLPHLHYPVE